MEEIVNQSSFSRTAGNESRMGAYYTELGHCIDISKMFIWPDEKVSVLEPSIGDGSAVTVVTGAKENPNVRIFGVELNPVVAAESKKNTLFESIIQADFTNGVKISKNAFSFCFGNPPYIMDSIEGERNERTFLEKVFNYLCKDGIIVWVIPRNTFMEISYFRYWHTHFETLCAYQFREEEYNKWKQWVIIGRKNRSDMLSKEQMEQLLKKYEQVPVLPSEFEDKIVVPPSNPDSITYFASKIFDVEEAMQYVRESKQLEHYIDQNITTPEFVSGYMGRPPIPMKKDSMYLLAVSGCGQGIAGTEGKDIHLQRGIAKVVEESAAEETEDGDSVIEKVTTKTQITMCIIENSGKISHLL